MDIYTLSKSTDSSYHFLIQLNTEGRGITHFTPAVWC